MLAAEQEQSSTRDRTKMFARISKDKNATLGDGARSVEQALVGVRPLSVCADKSTHATTDPASMRESAVGRYGDLYVQTGHSSLLQWHSKYTSQVLPFVIPRMVSGPDYNPAERWRRTYPDAPYVSTQEFTRAFARRIEASCRTDFSALPIIRSVAYKHTVEHTMGTVAPFFGRTGSASDT